MYAAAKETRRQSKLPATVKSVWTSRRSYWRLELSFLAIFFVALLWPTPAAAQFIPHQSMNRVVCDDFATLKSFITTLPDAKAAENVNYKEPVPLPGCVWFKGSEFLTAAEIGAPLGWAFLNPYTVAIHLVPLKGRPAYHASVIKPSASWRMQPQCDFWRKRLLLSTGEKQSLFGAIGNKMISSCLELVSLEQRSNELNQPILSYSSQWKSRPPTRPVNACSSTTGLAMGLDKVVNEQQILNNSTDIFSFKRGCFQRDGLDIVAARYLGLHLSNEFIEAKKFWFEIYQVVYIDRKSGALTLALLPTNTWRASQLRVSPQCMASLATLQDGGSGLKLHGSRVADIQGTQFSANGRAVQLPDMDSTPSGRDDCHIGNVFTR